MWKTFSRKLVLFGAGKEQEYLLDHLAVLMSSGLDISTALRGVSGDMKHRELRKRMNEMSEAIADGEKIWIACDRSGLFEPRAVSLIRVGETSGNLAENLNVISEQNQKDRLFRAQFLGAISYPAFVLLLGCTVGTWVLLYLLPQLSQTFASLNIELPLLTRILIATGEFTREYALVILIVLIVSMLTFAVVGFILPKTRWIGQGFVLAFPGVGSLIKDNENARIGYLIGTMLSAGLPIVETLQSISRATRLVRYKNFYTYLAREIDDGKTFQQAFDEYPKVKRVMNVSTQQLIVAAEQSGSLPQAYSRMGDFFSFRASLAAKNISIVLEPLLLLVIGIGVLFLALAVILPIYSITGGLE